MTLEEVIKKNSEELIPHGISTHVSVHPYELAQAIRQWIKENEYKCASCGKPLGRICDKCQRQWES